MIASMIVIGLCAVAASEIHPNPFYDNPSVDWETRTSKTIKIYPYQNLGIVLILIGFTATAIGFAIEEKKTKD